MSKKDAIIESAQTRLRPVLMTALTTIISMSTMAVGMGQGSEMGQPMAIVVVGGLTYGTLLTLIVVPCIYDALNREKDMREEDIEIVKAEEDPDLAIEDPRVMMQTAGAAVTVDPGASAGGYDSGAGSGGYAAGEVPEHYGTERPVDGSNAGMTDGGPGNGNI